MDVAEVEQGPVKEAMATTEAMQADIISTEKVPARESTKIRASPVAVNAAVEEPRIDEASPRTDVVKAQAEGGPSEIAEQQVTTVMALVINVSLTRADEGGLLGPWLPLMLNPE